MVETGNRTIKQKSALQHILNGVKNIAMKFRKNAMNQVTECELQVCNMRIVFLRIAFFFSSLLRLFFMYNNFT